MAVQIKAMTDGPPTKLLITFALPLMLGNVFQQLYTVVDTMIVGQGVGVHALAALGAGDWLNWMFLGIVQGLTQGFAIEIAQMFGAGREEDLRGTVGSSVVLASISAVVLVLLGLLLMKPVLLLLATPADILPLTMCYLRIMFLGTPFVMAYNLLACILRALGDGRTPLQAMVVACLVNIGLDLLFVLVFHWGIAGAAVATLLAQCASAWFCFLRLRKVPLLRLERKHFQLSGPGAKRLIGLGIPMACQNTLIAVGGMIMQNVVNGYGVLFIAGYTASNKLYGVLEIAATSYGYAMSTYVGQNLGARKLKRIKHGTRSGMIVAILTSLVITVLMLLLGRRILGLFISGTPEETAQTVEIAYRYLSIMSICLPTLYLLHVFRSSIQGMGNTVLPMVSGIAEFVMRTGGVLVLPLLLGSTGIFWSEVLAWMGADCILLPSYFFVLRRIEKNQIHKQIPTA